MDNVVVWRQGIFFIESKFLIPLYIAGEKKENENTGLYFPISIENRLNLSTTAHVIRIIFCILSVWLFFFFFCCCCCCLFIFPFFRVVRFPFHPQFFLGCSIFLFCFFFLLFILLNLLLTYLKPHSFFCAQTSLPAVWNGMYVMYGIYIVSALLHFYLVACYSVTLSKTVNPLTEKPLSRAD